MMRRNDKKIHDKELIYSIIQKAQVCRLALVSEDNPYIIPLNFGYKDNCLYIHSAPEGKKIDILKHNQKVCFEMDTDFKLIKAEKPCDYGASYYSVIGFGNAEFIRKLEKKRLALNIIMNHYTDKEDFVFDEKMLKNTTIIKIKIKKITGKQS
jgi:hypothetical protein